MIEFKANIFPSTAKVIEKSLQTYARANPFRYTEPEKYVEILNEFYTDEIQRRTQILARVEDAKRVYVPAILSMMSKRENIINTMVDWYWLYNPKNPPKGLPAAFPWIPWPDQIKYLEWIFTMYLQQRRGIIEKTREQAGTYGACIVLLHEWRWTPGFAGGMGSNILNNVDQRDNPDSIFEKIRMIMRTMPQWWMPDGFEWRKHDKIGNLVNPANGANIIGQGGLDIGRGGRRAIYFVDEKASLEFPLEADSSLSKNTDCQLDLSTPKGQNEFYTKRINGNLPVFTLHWKNNPMLDENWYAEQKKQFSPVIVAQEIDIDYSASIEGLCIEPKWVQAAVNLELMPGGVKSAGLDVGAGGPDDSALAVRTGPYVKTKTATFPNGVDLSYWAIDDCNAEGVEYLQADKLGVGHAVHSTLERTERKLNFKYYGLGAGEKASDKYYPEFDKVGYDIFMNARAEWWYLLARRFERTYEHVEGIRLYDPQELISIEANGQLIAELSSVKQLPTNTGKIKMESKADMRKRGVKSPNEADAVVLAFVPRDGGFKHVVEGFDAKAFEINWSEHRPDSCLNYGAICQMDDMSVQCLCAVWHEHHGHLYIYDELVLDYVDAERITVNLAEKMKLREFELAKILGNDPMFEKDRKSVARAINKKFSELMDGYQSVRVKEAKRYDPYGSLPIVNELIKRKRFTIHPRCTEALRQLGNWRLSKGKVKQTGMCEAVLMIVSELVQVRKIELILKMMEYTTREPARPEQPTGIMGA